MNLSIDPNKIGRKQKKEAYNHELIKSEEFYVNELEAVITHVVLPLTKNAHRCNVTASEIKSVFGIMQHVFQFHLQILRLIREEINVIPKMYQYFGFVQMYLDYMRRYSKTLDIMSGWTQSLPFREFVTLRLQNEHVKEAIDERLCSLPWYLYRPFERIKQYYRFFKDLLSVTDEHDDEYQMLLSMKNKLKPLYNKIKRRDVSFIKKTRLLEIQLQIFGLPSSIVDNHRYFVYNRICQIKTGGLTRRLKHIHLYVFNDMILWVSKRGHWKKTLRFDGDGIIYGKATKNNSANDPLLFIGASKDKHPTHILLANEQARDECLDRIKKAHQRYQTKKQRKLQQQPGKNSRQRKHETSHSNVSLYPPHEPSMTNSLTVDESFFDASATASYLPETMQMRALASHVSLGNMYHEDSSSSDDTNTNTNTNTNTSSNTNTNNNNNNNNTHNNTNTNELPPQRLNPNHNDRNTNKANNTNHHNANMIPIAESAQNN